MDGLEVNSRYAPRLLPRRGPFSQRCSSAPSLRRQLSEGIQHRAVALHVCLEVSVYLPEELKTEACTMAFKGLRLGTCALQPRRRCALRHFSFQEGNCALKHVDDSTEF